MICALSYRSSWIKILLAASLVCSFVFLCSCSTKTAEVSPTASATAATTGASSQAGAETVTTTVAATVRTTAATTVTTTTARPLRNGNLENQPYSDGEDSGIYSGGYRDDLRHGYGEFRFDNGEVYAGYWEADRMHGEGEYTVPGFGSVLGVFRDGKLDESEVTIRYQDGSVYLGSLREGKRDGWGRMDWANGDWYEGSFSGDAQEGWGKSYFASTDSLYEGSYAAGRRTGTGKLTYSDGSVFEGTFRDGSWVEGTLTFPGGDWMQGQFPDGKATGDYYYYDASEDIYRWAKFQSGEFVRWIEAPEVL